MNPTRTALIEKRHPKEKLLRGTMQPSQSGNYYRKGVIFFLLILSSIGCTSDFQSFNEMAMKLAKDDNRIDKDEFEQLLQDISNSEGRRFSQFKDEDGIINNAKVFSYLFKYYSAKNLNITKDDIWQPKSSSQPTAFNINVYLENSASMDGYVTGVTDFEAAIYNLLGDFKISQICDSLNLNYINNSIPYSKRNALPADIQDFIEKLEPSTFRQRGGDRSVSDLKNVVNTVLSTVNDKNAAVLISDFVFSPGSGVDAQDYLNNQGVGIKIDFAEKIKMFDLAAVVIQLISNFDGLYYNKTNKPIRFKGERPYYVWILGSNQQIRSILEKKILNNIKGGYLNRFILQSTGEISELNYKILSNPKIGEFSRYELKKQILTDASVSKNNQNKGLFGFSIAVDFGKNIHDDNYFLDPTNYVLSNPNYELEVDPILNKSDLSLSGFTHLMKLKTSSLRSEALEIKVVGRIPDWVDASSSIDDSNILNERSEQQKTFGLEYLIEGVSDAFYPKSSSNVISTFTVTIKKKK